MNSEIIDASVAELADAPDLGSGIQGCGGSTPLARIFFAELFGQFISSI